MATSKKGLGKGLGNLIPSEPSGKNANKTSEKKVTANQNVVEKIIKVEEPTEIKLKLTEIEPNREQPRKVFDEDALLELSESIRQYGVIEPLVVQKRDDYYEIIAGERRWRAAKLAGIKEVPVVIKDYSEQEIVEISLIENIQREDLNPIEEAQAYERLSKEFGLKQDEIAEKVSKSRSAITNSMRLLKLDSRVQQMLVDDMISSGHARALLAVEDMDEQYSIAQSIFDHNLNVRDTEKLIKNYGKAPKQQQKKNDFIYKDIENKLKEKMKTKVVIKNKDNNKGKIEIDYYSMEDLERIIDLLNNIQE